MDNDNKLADHWKRRWVWEGLGWGVFMFLIMGILFPLAEKKQITTTVVITSLLYWLVGGLIYGYMMKLFLQYISRKKKGKTLTDHSA